MSAFGQELPFRLRDCLKSGSAYCIRPVAELGLLADPYINRGSVVAGGRSIPGLQISVKPKKAA